MHTLSVIVLCVIGCSCLLAGLFLYCACILAGRADDAMEKLREEK